MLFILSSSSEADFGDSSDSDSGSDGGEFRPPAGSLRTMSASSNARSRMSLRSSPRKQQPPMRPTRPQRTSPRKLCDANSTLASTDALLLSSRDSPPPRQRSPRKKASPLRPANEQLKRFKPVKQSASPRLKQSPPTTPNKQQSASTLVLAAQRQKRADFVRQNATASGQHRPKPVGRPKRVKCEEMAEVKKEWPPSENEEESGIDGEEEDGEEDLFMATNSLDEFFGEDCEEEESSEEEDQKPELPPSIGGGFMAKIVAAAKSLVSGGSAPPRKRGRPANNNNGLMREMKSAVGKKQTTTISIAMLNNYTNPFEAAVVDGEVQELDQYRRKMRDFYDLSRYLGQADSHGFCRRPVHKPFLNRNLFYLREQEMKTMAASIKSSPLATINRTSSSRTSLDTNKLPSTIKFELIRNVDCFGHKSAIVECFLTSEVDGRCGPLKRIPSAIFKKAVNERISTFIDLDLPEDCQPAALQASKCSRAEFFVVRVVFRMEDAAIGGRHLRKVPARNRKLENDRVLRKDGPTEGMEVTMFGAVKILAFAQEEGIQVERGEASIILHTAAELGMDDLSTKSSGSQVARLINAASPNKNKATLSTPFIRLSILSEDDDEEEEADMERANAKEEVKMERIMEELRELEEATSSAASLGKRGAKNGEKERLLLEGIPPRICVKFMLSPPTFAIPPPAADTKCSPGCSKDGPPSRKRLKLCQSDSSNEELVDFGEDGFMDEEWHGKGAAAAEKLSGPEHKLRVFTPSPCFLCKAQLKLDNLRALWMHLRFAHPRFEFAFESNITVNNHLQLPGFTMSLNNRFDGSFENERDGNDKQEGSSRNHKSKSKRKNLQKRNKVGGLKPVCLVNKQLAEQVRANPDFPIERFQAMSIRGDNEHLLKYGRFANETPTRIDQAWLIETQNRRIDEYTDLRADEREFMKMWNAHILRIRITQLGFKFVYPASRVFVKNHAQKINDGNLRLAFLCHLIAVHNANEQALDKEEVYDVFRRLDPDFNPQTDNPHFVAGALTALEEERENYLKAQQNNGGGGNQQQSGSGGQVKLANKGASPQKKRRPSYEPNPIIDFNSFVDLKARYPFASDKRLTVIWKFLRDYDYSDFKMQ